MTSNSVAADPRSLARSPASQPYRARIRAAEQAANPLLEAARPLLQALADTPTQLDACAIADRRQWLTHEVRIFGRLCAELQLRPDHVEDACYCLCSALDEAAMQTRWGKGVATGTEWDADSLAVAAGYDRQGGDRVFRIAEQAMRNPHGNLDLIEVLQNIFDLGFRGRYRFEAGGAKVLRSVREQVHDVVVTSGSGLLAYDMHHMHRRTIGLLPRRQVDPWVRPASSRKTRAWIVTGLLCATLLGAACSVMYWRLTHAEQPDPAIPSIQALASDLTSRLDNEIAAGTVILSENTQHTALTLRFNNMFAPGESTVNPWVGPLIATIGREIARTPAKVRVTGYTDNLPAGKSQRISNQALSDLRAQQVVQILIAAGVPSDRVDATGKGETDPVAENTNAEGRTRNRRVEINVSQ